MVCKIKVIVLADKGMLGHMVYNYLNETNEFTVVGLDKKHFNATWDKLLLQAFLDELEPNYVINCIGHLNKNSEEEKKETWYLNTIFPNILADIGDEMGFKLIHVSSDCAFDNNTYGMSKLAGEIRRANHLTIRTSIIGPELKEGSGLLHWALRQKGQVNGYINHFWNGVTTLELAKFIHINVLLNTNTENINPILQDIRVIKSCSKAELLGIIYNTFKSNNIVINKTTEIIDKRIPASFWVDNKISIQKELPDQLNELFLWITSHKELYEKIYPELFK